jgi:hypothetical protein
LKASGIADRKKLLWIGSSTARPAHIFRDGQINLEPTVSRQAVPFPSSFNDSLGGVQDLHVFLRSVNRGCRRRGRTLWNHNDRKAMVAHQLRRNRSDNAVMLMRGAPDDQDDPSVRPILSTELVGDGDQFLGHPSIPALKVPAGLSGAEPIADLLAELVLQVVKPANDGWVCRRLGR